MNSLSRDTKKNTASDNTANNIRRKALEEKIIVLYYEGYTTKEIAKMLNVPEIQVVSVLAPY